MSGMSPIVQTVTRKLAPFTMAFGFYIVIYGHLTPGGGFQGGTILAGVFILFVLALGRQEAFRHLKEGATHVMDCVGALAFLGLALLGYAWVKQGAVEPFFFGNFVTKGQPFHIWSSGGIFLANIFIALKVWAALFAGFAALAAFRREEKAEEDQA